jgi:hypothetical protein
MTGICCDKMIIPTNKTNIETAAVTILPAEINSDATAFLVYKRGNGITFVFQKCMPVVLGTGKNAFQTLLNVMKYGACPKRAEYRSNLDRRMYWGII